MAPIISVFPNFHLLKFQSATPNIFSKKKKPEERERMTEMLHILPFFFALTFATTIQFSGSVPTKIKFIVNYSGSDIGNFNNGSHDDYYQCGFECFDSF